MSKFIVGIKRKMISCRVLRLRNNIIDFPSFIGHFFSWFSFQILVCPFLFYFIFVIKKREVGWGGCWEFILQHFFDKCGHGLGRIPSRLIYHVEHYLNEQLVNSLLFKWEIK